MYKLGLIGSPLSHSFSKIYFDEKFKKEKIYNFSYSLYQINNIMEINTLIMNNNVIGLNVTRPYKTDVIQYLDTLDDTARYTNSVNTIFIDSGREKKIGFNTDIMGFDATFNKLNTHEKKALILGNSSVSKTISYYFKQKKIKHLIVSRNPKKNMIKYCDIQNVINEYKLIVNTTPLGQYPDHNQYPKIPYNLISKRHYCIDLIYNPKKTFFLTKCESKGAKIINGETMLKQQAEASWKIWKKMIKENNV